MINKIKLLLDIIFTNPWMVITLCIFSIIALNVFMQAYTLWQILVIASLFTLAYGLLFRTRRKRLDAENASLSSVKRSNDNERHRSFWLSCYFALYVNISFSGTDPQWLITLEYIFSIGALLCIMLYTFRIRPDQLNLILQIFPVCLVVFDIYDLIYFWVKNVQLLHFPVRDLTITSANTLLLKVPSWYISFRLGYPKDDEAEDSVVTASSK